MGSVWFALTGLALVDAAWLMISPQNLSPGSLAMILCLAPLLVVAWWSAARLDDRPRLRILISGASFLLLAWPALRLLNHLSMATSLPLADDWLAAADRALGFNWLAYLLWLDRHPWLVAAMDLTYGRLTEYSALLFVLLLLTRNAAARCAEMIALFFATAVAFMSIGMFFPARSAAAHYRFDPALFANIDPIKGAYHLRHLDALRGDPGHVLHLPHLPGLVTFPSFHTAMGLIAIYCARDTRWLFAIMLVVNGLMIASTPLFGAHYVVDILGGAVVAALIIAAYRHGLFSLTLVSEKGR